MTLEALDGYLLGTHGSKAAVIQQLLEDRSTDPQAAPFYRALEMLGPRVADEALMALRLVLAGLPATDEAVKKMRTLLAASREGGEGALGARDQYAQDLA